MSKNSSKSSVAVIENETIEEEVKSSKSQEVSEETKKMIVHVDRKVGEDFKVLAELRGKSQISLIAELIENYTSKNKEAIENYMELRNSIKSL